jgi:MoaA/NifB/PqqE/SkfB family radical SAM enzyme
LLRGLLDREEAKVGPFFATVLLTRRCNLHCPACPYHSPLLGVAPSAPDPVDFPLDLFARLVGELRDQGTKSLVLTGEGEPFLHAGLLDMIRLAKDAGLHVSVQTNGTLIRAEHVSALPDTGLDVLRVSLWASSRATYQANYPYDPPELFDHVLARVRELVGARQAQARSTPQVVLHYPITRLNFAAMDAVGDLAAANGFDGLSFSPLHNPQDQVAGLTMSAAETSATTQALRRLKRRLRSQELSHNVDDVLRAYQIGENTWARLACYIAWLHVLIRPDGTVAPCCRCRVPLGSLSDQTLADIWNAPPIRAFRRRAGAYGGGASLARECECGCCPHLRDNDRVHRIWRCISPWRRKAEGVTR